MEVGLFWWWSLDDVHLWRSLTHSFVSNSSGDDFIPIDKASWWCVIIFYLDLHSFVANGPCYYCIELWLILGVSLMKLLWKFFFFFLRKILWKFLMLVLGMNWFVKKEKSTGTFEMYFSCFGPFWVGVWQLPL